MVGDVVEVGFPFTDLSSVKTRPAVVLAEVGMGDWILCEVTSRRRQRPGDIEITADDMNQGELECNSWARPSRLHTLHESLFGEPVGRLTDTKLSEILAEARNLF